MKYISRKINLSQYKSFLQGKVLSVKNNEIIDITQQCNQIKYNALSNYSMMPLTCRVNINNGEELLWAWHTLHKIYVFLKNTEKDDICWENESSYSEYLEILKADSKYFKENFDELKTDIINYVENNKNGNLIDFNVVDENDDLCGGETYTFITIPLSITNNIDNLGQMSNLMDDWQEKTKYNKGNVAVFDNKDWRLNNTGSTSTENDETFINGYTWNDKYKENVFGNLTFDDNSNQYVYKLDKTQWERNIDCSINKNGSIHASFLGGKLLDDNILTYAYLDNEYFINPSPSSTAKKYSIIKPNKEFIVDNNIVYLFEDYYFVENFGCEENSLLVQFDCGVPFIEFKGERYYGYKEDEEEIYYFEYKLMTPWQSHKKRGFFYNNIFCEKEGNSVVLGKNYRTYDICSISDAYVIVNETIVILKNGTTPYIYEYNSLNETNDKWSIFSSEKYSLKQDTNWILNTNCEVNNDYFKVYRDYKEHVLNYVSGTTASQLVIFKLPSIFDNLGKEFAAIFSEPKNTIVENKYTGILRPIVNDYLSLQYKKGTTNNLIIESKEELLYWGNILTNIDFFVTDSSGKQIYEFVLDDENISTGDQLKDIYENYTLKYDESHQLNVYKDKTENDLAFDDALTITNSSLKVRFTYYIGAIIKEDEDTQEFSLLEDGHKGVEYTESYTVKRVEDIYGRGRYNKYKVYRFDLIGEPLDDEFDEGEGYSKAYFRTELPIYKKVQNYVNIDGNEHIIEYPVIDNKIVINNVEYIVDGNVIYNDDDEDNLKVYQIFTKATIVNNNHFKENENGDFDPYRNFIASPTIMHEYNIGTAYQEKIFENIYIDRGASSAFEKHLKLQEIETLQDLENYSNGGFFSITSVN